MRICFVILTCVLLVAKSHAQPSRDDLLATSLNRHYDLDFCGEQVPLSDPDVRERFEKQLLLTLQDRAQVILWIKRSGRYMPFIETVLRQNELPSDLKYISIIESALRPHATSSKNAVGFWQFTESAGRENGLRVDPDVDERRNVFKSTRAAVTYFKGLYDQYGSWSLCAAAYNMGEDGLQTEMLMQDERDYYRLYLSLETQQYVMRIVCAKLVLSDPQRFGFDTGEIGTYPALQFDQVIVNRPEKTPISLIAKAAKTDFKQIKDLNPEIRGHYLAEGRHTILVPAGHATGFDERLQQILREEEVRNRNVYVVEEGDNLSTIAAKFGVSLGAILIWNNLGVSDRIHPGDRIVIFGP
jgi:hypothetical protein